MKISISLICTLLFVSCTNSLTGPLSSKKIEKRAIASTPEQPELFKGEKWGDEEVDYMNEIEDIFRKKLIASTGKNKKMLRDAHPKQHGCVASELTIDNTKLPKELRVGLFEKNRMYPSIIRFSNGDPDASKIDLEKDVRGMALKIIGVENASYLENIGLDNEREVHDMVMMNADSFFISNPKSYVNFMRATNSKYGVMGYLLTHWKSLSKILGARVQISNSLDIDYTSATPYRLGDMSMKFKFKSCKENKDSIPKKATANYLGERLEETLANSEGCFNFMIQPNRNEEENNIEDAMASWDEKESPFISVGKLIVNKQTGFRSPSRNTACENMTFNPWRAPEENRPIGGVNRIRLQVYLNQAKLRHDYNGIK